MGKKKIVKASGKKETKPKKEKAVEKDVDKKETEESEVKKRQRKVRVRGKNYLAAKKAVGDKEYKLDQAIKLAKKTSISKFIGSLEVHMVIDKKSEAFEIKMPYFKGKEKKVVVLTDKVVADIKSGKIDFDVLVASPKQMGQIVPFVKLLGPKGLMPNPKNGTLVDDPKKAAEELSGGGMKVKTEKKQPVIHLTVGKLDQPDKELVANIEALVKKIGKARISKISVCATMGPGIKVSL